MKKSEFARTVTRALALAALFALLAAPTCNQPFGPIDTGSGSTHKTLNAFGDSIAAGYEDTGSFPGQIKSYVGYYADEAATGQDWSVTYQGFTTSGETTPQIHSRMLNNVSQLREAEVFTWDAGGNDFLDARSAYYSNCSVAGLDAALDAWRADWDDVIDAVAANVGTTADSAPAIRTMNIYYPNPDEDRGGACPNQRIDFEVLLPRLMAASDYMCFSAEQRGWRCADSLAAMNCEEDGNNNPAFNCPNKRYIQDLVDSGICPRNVTSPNFREPTVDVDCITAHLDATNDWDAVIDPVSIRKRGQTVTLIQTRDRTHPNANGHREIGRAHHETGYDDVEGDQVEDNYALCIDYLDNDGDGRTDCADSGCANYCL